MSSTTLPRPLRLQKSKRGPTSAAHVGGSGTPSGDSSANGFRRLLRGRAEDAPWVRPALILLLVGTAVAYLWNLSASGYANSFYAAAVQAATKSWKAFLFGSIDSSNFITVDKPPASLWVMALSGRLFGFSGLSVLVPQVLEGVVSVGLLYAAVKRWFGGGAALLAGLVLALTPVAALMFRFNNPDALLVCLLTASAYCLVRALESGSTRWMIGVGTLIGFGFLTKMGQAFLVLPGFALVYLVAAPVTLRRRLGQLLAGGAALLVSAGWWVVLVTLWPVASRPMIDGSSDNSILNLIVGYNGLGRIFGGGGGPGGGGAPGGGGGGGGGFGGEPGVLRLFNSLMGGQASWLIPAALGVLVLGLWSTRRAPRTDRHRAALLLWGSWLLVSAAVFSLSSGIIHTYYTVALAPAIAALVGVGAAWLWQCRGTVTARIGLVVGVASTAAWAWILLDRTPSWEPWLRTLIPVAAVMAVIILLGAPLLRRFSRPVAIAAATLCLVAGLGGPTAYAAQTIGAAHTGSVPSAGPSTGVGGGPGSASGSKAPTSSAGGVPSLFSPSGRQTGSVRAEGAPGRGAGLAGAGGAGGPGGGSSAQVSSALVKALKSGASSYRWVAATSGSQSAASLELASGGEPVMAIGGFSGQGGELTLTQFEHYVKAGQIHYYLASGGGPGGGSGSSSIVSWVEAHYKAETISGQTIYDLTSPK